MLMLMVFLRETVSCVEITVSAVFPVFNFDRDIRLPEKLRIMKKQTVKMINTIVTAIGIRCAFFIGEHLRSLTNFRKADIISVTIIHEFFSSDKSGD